MWEPFLYLALAVSAWRFIRRRSRPETAWVSTVGDAPDDAEPIAFNRLNDDGLATYRLDLNRGSDRHAGALTGVHRRGELDELGDGWR